MCLWCLGSVQAAETLKDLPVHFTGNHYVTSTELKRSAQEEFRQFSEHHRESDLFDASFNILQYLRNNGHYFARVEYTFMPNRLKPTSVLFTVSERQQVIIDTISITGAPSWSQWNSDDISFTIGSPIKGLLKYFGVGELIFRQIDVDNAINTITTSYLLHGYQKVRVELDKLEWNQQQNKVNIHITVQEGPQYTYKHARFNKDLNNSNISEDTLNSIIEAHHLEGTPFHPRHLQSHIATIRYQLFIRGYLNAAVSGRYTFQEDRQVDAEVDIQPGPQFIYDSLIITGNTHTKIGIFEFYTHLLRTGVPIYYNQVERSLSYLYKLGIFKNVTWDKIITRQGDGVVYADLLIQVEELPKNYIDLSLGYGSYEQLRAGIEYHNRNVFGYGIEGDIGAYASLKSQRTEANLFWGGYYRRRFFSLRSAYEIRDEPSFTSEILDGTLRYREQFAMFEEKGDPDPYGIKQEVELWESQITYSAELSKATNITAGSTANEDALFLSSLGWALIYDSRNDPFNPSKGVRFRASAEWSHELIGSDLDFVLYETSIKNHFSFDQQGLFVLATHLRVNTYDLRNEQLNMPIQKRLFLGGENTVRSFNRYKLGSFDAEGDPLGGLSTGLLSIEVRFPLAHTYNLSGALFYDAGLVDPLELNFDADIGQGIGFGLRFDLPIGPIRLDVAHNIGETFASNDDYVIHFALGFSF